MSCKYPFFLYRASIKFRTLPGVVFWCFLEFVALLKAVSAIFLSTVCTVLRERLSLSTQQTVERKIALTAIDRINRGNKQINILPRNASTIKNRVNNTNMTYKILLTQLIDCIFNQT